MSLKMRRPPDTSHPDPGISYEGTVAAAEKIYANLEQIDPAADPIVNGDKVLDYITDISIGGSGSNKYDVINIRGTKVVRQSNPGNGNYNTKLRVKRDDQENAGHRRPVMNMGLPLNSPLDEPDYLEEILTIIQARFGAGDTPQTGKLQKFLLGIITLTKCR